MIYELILPLTAAIIFTLGSIFSKRGFHEGATAKQGFYISCLFIALTPLPLLFFETKPIPWENLHQVMICGFLLYIGNWLALLGVHRGDVSIVTPVLGTKVVFVAIATVFLTNVHVPASLWIAAILTPVGILVLGARDMHANKSAIWQTIGFALASAACFSLFDVLVFRWAREFGAFAFVSLSSAVMAVPAASRLLLYPELWRDLSKASRSWLGLGGFSMGFQASLLGLALAFAAQATQVNVVYASRGLWSIVLVWLLGHWFRLEEKSQKPGVFAWRLAGAIILTSAIVLAIVS